MWTAIAEGLVWPFGVVPLNPMSNGSASFGEVAEVMLPDTLLFKAAKETLDDTVLLRRIRSNEFLAQPIVTTGGTKASALENQAIITTHHRGRAIGTQRTEPRQAGLLERPLGFLGTTAQSELKARDLAVVTINNRGQMTPAV